jgi:hypothetical protein
LRALGRARAATVRQLLDMGSPDERPRFDYRALDWPLEGSSASPRLS